MMALDMQVYKDNGHVDRYAYMVSLAKTYGVTVQEVLTISDPFGPSEDFDGLINALEDYTLT